MANGILRFIARRLLLALPVFVGVTLVTFVLMQIVPGDPVAVQCRWLPPSGYGPAFPYLIMPAITLGTGLSAVIARLTRSSMLDVIRADYIRTARAKGLAGRRVFMVHALRNAAIPIVTVIGVQMSGLLSGAVITERVFSWPGIGRLF